MKRTFVCASSCIKHYVQPSYGCCGKPVVAGMCVYTARKNYVIHTVFLSGFGPRGGKTAICNLVGGHGSLNMHSTASSKGGESEPRGGKCSPRPPPERNPDIKCNYKKVLEQERKTLKKK